MNKQITIIISLAIIAVAVIITSTRRASKIAPTNEKIKVGIITMTTGNLAFLGENIVNSARLAAVDLGRTDDIEFIIEDVGNIDNQGISAVAATKKLIEVDQVQFIINGMTSNGTMAAAPVINTAKVVTITPLTGGQNIDESGEYVFRNGPSDILGGIQPARDFTNKFGYKSVALLTDKAEYTLDIVKHFKSEFTDDIVLDEELTPDSKDFRTVALRTKSTNPEAIFINTATGVTARYAIKQIRELGITTPIFTNFLAFGPDLIKEAGQYAEGVYVYDPEYNETDKRVANLLLRYTATYGHESPIAFHTTGTYDALRMGLQAIDVVGYDGTQIHDYLLKHIQDWSGLNGTVSFDANGNSGTGFVLKVIKDGKLVRAQ